MTPSESASIVLKVSVGTVVLRKSVQHVKHPYEYDIHYSEHLDQDHTSLANLKHQCKIYLIQGHHMDDEYHLSIS